LPATGSSLVIEASPGVYDIVVWAEPNIWNATTHTPITAPTSMVTLTLGSGSAQISVFDPLTSANPLSVASGASSATVAVTDHPMIIQVSNLVAAMASLAAPAASAQPVSPTTPNLAALAPPRP
jgi:hypothetical protein